MPEIKDLYKGIPRMDELMEDMAKARPGASARLLKDAVNAELSALREDIAKGLISDLPARRIILDAALARLDESELPSLRPVINGTGIIIHTKLGRSCLSDRAAAAVYEVAKSYNTLEYDVEAGERGSRHSHIEELICSVSGAEAAMVVNNNAGAVLLILSALAAGGEVIVSRGELVEIGGSFRIPDIMEACGCTLREVGTTNKTHAEDYEAAINEKTKALLKVHTSNYRIVGFSRDLSLSEMKALGEKHGLPVIQDLGSGCFIDLGNYGIEAEPTVQESVKSAADIISFSGDKLLGSAQAGIIVGKKHYIDLLKKHPLARALRVDKMTLAALRETLRAYLDEGRADREIPSLAMIAETPQSLKTKAEAAIELLKSKGFRVSLCELEDQVGGGSLPNQMLKGWGIEIEPVGMSVNRLEELLRKRSIPIIGRINKDRYLLSVRTLRDGDLTKIAEALGEIFG
ncbi:MAG TPA: L-seryl-tRNA(Sec) selenium transferase [Bacillota bacterium]|nr:L-seryl-tRNA(Sec) selenium transferase [Bacillota bacterium]